MTVVTSFSRVEDLVPGDLGSIVSARDMLGAGITPSQAVATTLSGVRVQGWKGVGADQFAQVSLREPERVAALPVAFSRASSAMSVWEAAFNTARSAATDAIQLAARADALTAQSQAEHRQAVVAAQSTSAAAAVQAPPLFVDRGAALNAQAQATLASALATLDAVGADVAAAIRPTAGWSPTDPEDRNGWDKVLFFPTDFFGSGIILGFVEQLAGLAEAGWWIFETFDPFRFIADQFQGGDQWSDEWWANFSRRFGEVGDSISFIFTNPGDVLGALLADFFAVELWANEPGAAMGRVVLNVVLLASGVGGLVKGVKGLTIMAKAAQAARIEKLELAKLEKLAKLETRASELLDGSTGVKVQDGQVLINGKPKMSVAEWTDGYKVSIHNMDAGRATLGKWIEDSPDSYEKIAEASGDAYFNMPSSPKDLWAETQKKYGLSNDEMFELYNKPFLEEIVEKGLPIRFTRDPRSDPDSYLAQEWIYLDKKGYVLADDALSAKPRK
ncbi:MAG: hypothetical protein IJG47_14450 [Microbacterium sp.]|nr:hypothetical protein [Microbacterium sp.]